MHQREDALAFGGFEGCASSREFWWHLAADNERLWDRFPAATSWDWTPGDDCEMAPLSGAAIVKDMIESGGWLLIGDSVTENHFFSLSCVLFPHVRATPNYTENPYFDRAWPQHLYLAPESPLIPHLRLPPGFTVEDTPLVTFRRVDLLLDRAELEGLYAARTAAGAPPLFSDEQFWSLSPEYYVRDLFLDGHYGTLLVSTGGHWTTTLMSAFRDEGARGQGIDGVLALFDAAMRRWAEDVQGALDAYERRGRRWGLGRRRERKQVVVRAYVPGHEDCHAERAPWAKWRPYVWNWYNWANIGEFNKIFEDIVGTGTFPDIHYLGIDQPALLRPDAHSTSDCLHIMTGAGVLEGWTHYVWHFVTREIPARVR
ncbi:hypothetical protein DAEQUDRAFT_747087 [Daedalea quercina L-15889]|uniref:Uncharacterized protein n=1 Tax=Daedalea quercina L-15889 TaxID=1314783 RepID=A0A165M8L7_9APHY|nr:hypothetical protein DAEQUDRAFT_747087 [Daedalea quercina L-15889]